MRITQDELEFKPITITLETNTEAVALLKILDFFESKDVAPSDEAWDLIVKLSYAFSDYDVMLSNYKED